MLLLSQVGEPAIRIGAECSALIVALICTPSPTVLRKVWKDNFTADEAELALKSAVDGCDLFCMECETEEGCGSHREEHWTHRRCSSCVDANCDCHTLVVRFVAMDCCGEQAGLIRRAFQDDWDDATWNARGTDYA